MALKHIATVTHRELLWKRVATEDGHGFTSVRDGYTVGELYISIDAELLAQMIGGKAFRNKKHQTQLQSGAVVVEAAKIRREP